jgi:hypothetical protein
MLEYKNLSRLRDVKISGHVSGFGGCSHGVCHTVNVAPNTTIEGPYSFEECKGLEVVNFCENVDVHGNNVFQNCSSLIELNFSKRLRLFGNATFAGCGIRTLVIPDGTIIDRHYSFGNCLNLHSVEFGDDCEVLGDSTFEGCLNLLNIKAGKRVKFLGKNTLDNCPNFQCIFGYYDIVLKY